MQLHHYRRALKALETDVYVIGFEPENRARVWLEQAGVGFPFLLDHDRSAYAAYELHRSVWRSWHPRNLWFYFKRFVRGESIPRFKADPNQLGGDFLIDAGGTIRLAYYGKDATDRPPVDLILGRLRELTSGAP